ncbi:hypothetical protein J6590_005081 [Homalodisca vitripennis]|nr:hypothetical protein J6590_005081 [Homalodisca vitripennis]
MDPLHQANKLRLIHIQTDNKWTYREAIMLDTLMLMSSLVQIYTAPTSPPHSSNYPLIRPYRNLYF